MTILGIIFLGMVYLFKFLIEIVVAGFILGLIGFSILAFLAFLLRGGK